MKFVAVTSCPTGIAHSQMAAENLERVAAANGHEIIVEVRGAMGRENELSSDDIATADAVIVAAETAVGRDRFEGTPVVEAPVKAAVTDADGLLEQAAEAAYREGADTDPETSLDGDHREPVADSANSRDGQSSGLVARLKRFFS
ncbi:PTS fructose transporter subunit IIB [Halopiger aswanensis]|uniref:PTS system fructose-specific IIB component n=1 Tax=Halopiger aswanensis TaxID=148449 RepID=A0A3R7GYJ3_9EURY|nr:PTS fructose transporter subunit IIB [Halopiger aswanensis]RKD98011.1 PTS system fructose-specific IIB component [Halopiger aswanensis]